jgi:glycogen(starch) synthase
MKICFITREYPPDSAWGGIAYVYYELALELVRQGHEVHVVCQSVGKPTTLKEGGVFVHRVGRRPKRNSILARIDYSIHALYAVRRLMSSNCFDIVETPLFGGEVLLPLVMGIRPVIVDVYGLHIDSLRLGNHATWGGALSLALLSVAEPFLLLMANKVVVTTSNMHQRLVANRMMRPTDIRIIPMGVDTEVYRFTESNVREDYGIARDAYLVLFVGRLERNKGPHILCRAIPTVVERMPNSVFLFVGGDTRTGLNHDSFLKYMIEMVRMLKIESHVKFIGPVQISSLPAIYSACDVFVLPSINDDSPRVVYEAMACEKPVIASNLPFLHELQYEADVYGVKVGDHEDLASSIIEYGMKVSRRHPRNRKVIDERFSISARARRFVDLYKEAIKGLR